MQTCQHPYLEPSASIEFCCCPWGWQSTDCVSAGVLDETETLGLFILVSISFANKWLLPDACFKWQKIILKILKRKEGRGSAWCLQTCTASCPGAGSISFWYIHLWCREEICCSEESDHTCEPPDIYRWKAEAAETSNAQSRARSHRDVPTSSAAAGMRRAVRGESCFTSSGTSDVLQEGHKFRSLCLYTFLKISLWYIFFKIHSVLSVSESEKQESGAIRSCSSNLGTKGRSLCLFPVELTYRLLVCPSPGAPVSLQRVQAYLHLTSIRSIWIWSPPIPVQYLNF